MFEIIKQYSAKLGRGAKRGFCEITEFKKNLQFGLLIAFKTYIAHVFPCRLTKKTRNKAICNLLANMLEDELYEKSPINEKVETTDYPVWICWFTGIENSPELVQACFDSITRNMPPKASIHVITLDNFQEYFELPEYCLDKYRNGTMTAAALSDIIRACLLSKYGGLWLDATILLINQLPESFFDNPFFTLKSTKLLPEWKEPSEGKWCNFIWYSKVPGNPLFDILREGLLKYWEKYDRVVEYLLPDYFIRVAYENVPAVANMIDDLPSNTDDFWYCVKHMEDPFSESLWRRINDQGVFHKLTYKVPWEKYNESGNETLYQHILNQFHFDIKHDT